MNSGSIFLAIALVVLGYLLGGAVTSAMTGRWLLALAHVPGAFAAGCVVRLLWRRWSR